MTDEQSASKDNGESGRKTVAAVIDDEEALRREIQLRAYYRYCDRGCAPGADVEDWLAAEREVLANHAAQVPAPFQTPGDPPDRRGRRHGQGPR